LQTDLIDALAQIVANVQLRLSHPIPEVIGGQENKRSGAQRFLATKFAYGWKPTVVASPGDLIGYQRRVEEIENRLHFQFALRD
jgi:hypothetical protein